MLHGHGSDSYKYKTKIVADFSSNIWHKGLPDGLKEYLVKAIDNLVYYPEPDAGKLMKQLAHFHNLSEDEIIVTNGSSEAFYLLAQALKTAQSYIIYPCFAEYIDACSINQHKLVYINNGDIDFSQKLEPNSLVWMGNPNNPDGKLFNVENLAKWMRINPFCYFIVDEAYGDLCYGFESMLVFLNELDNLIVIKSLTKTFAIPGLRLGYIVSNPKISGVLKLFKIPWSVNALAIEAGLFVIDKYEQLVPNKALLYQECRRFQNGVNALEGIEVTESTTNYFLARLKQGNVAMLKEYLAIQHALLIRDASNFKGLTSQHFRLSLHTEELNEKLIEALKSWLANE
ncbi:MAG: aminotransferase class I/II-fold pyridoxal phosphate-dependent enzyme [Salinivirgaceae bacterium]|jgi:threonine-phosphate decarboxylase|nr:aminotransferase class I/II-fold pyridoxal phosphate-dependent enzyme [Salinivirgaceae bacterium]